MWNVPYNILHLMQGDQCWAKSRGWRCCKPLVANPMSTLNYQPGLRGREGWACLIFKQQIFFELIKITNTTNKQVLCQHSTISLAERGREGWACLIFEQQICLKLRKIENATNKQKNKHILCQQSTIRAE